jgi:hypothetical protein
LFAGDEFWIGAGGSRFDMVLAALGRTLVQHNKNTEAQAEADDEELDEDSAEELFEEASLEKLGRFLEEVQRTSAGTRVAAAIAGLPKKSKAAFAELLEE